MRERILAPASALGATAALLALLVIFTQPGLAAPRAPTGVRTQNAARTPPTQSFHSAPGLHPPTLTVTADPDQQSGDIFVTPFNSSQSGPMILDSQGRLVWFRPVPGDEALDLQVQRYQGQHVLTWWQGGLSVGHGTIYGLGEDVIAEQLLPDARGAPRCRRRSDRPARVPDHTAGDGSVRRIRPGPHEPDELWRPGRRSGSRLCDPGAGHQDGPSSLAVAFAGPRSVDSLLHSRADQLQRVVDYFHLNSIQQLPDGNLLVSSRSTWSIYEISKSTGAVLWILGESIRVSRSGPAPTSSGSTTPVCTRTGFSACSTTRAPRRRSPRHRPSSSSLDTTTMTATLFRRYTHSPPLLAGLAGNTQILPNDDRLRRLGRSTRLFRVHAGWPADLQRELRHRGRDLPRLPLPLDRPPRRPSRPSRPSSTATTP